MQRVGGEGMTIQELFEWANENDALNKAVRARDGYGEWAYAEEAEKKEAHGVVEVRIW